MASKVEGKKIPWDTVPTSTDKVAEQSRKDASPVTLSKALVTRLEKRKGARK